MNGFLKRYRAYWIAAVILCFCIVTGMLTLQLAGRAAEPELVGGEIKEVYELNEEIVIPDAQITMDGKSYPAQPYLYYPDQNRYSVAKAKLNMAGQYKLTYRAQIGGRMRDVSQTFMVYNPLASVSARADSLSYGSHPATPDISGLVVRLSYGSTFEFNQVIDLRKMTKDDNLITLYMTPEQVGAADAKQIFIQLTDVYDAKNYITIRYNQTPDGITDVTYVTAKAHNQGDYFGSERGLVDGSIYSGNYGFASKGSFYGINMASESSHFKCSFDNKTNTVHALNNVYASNTGDYVIDFGNTVAFSSVWDGFTTGEVRLSVYCSNYQKASAGFVITNIAGFDLRQKTAVPTVLPEIVVDYGDFTETDYPNALISYPYKLFEGKVREKFGLERMETRVYFGYNTTSQTEMVITDGRFEATWAGEYVVEYKAFDRYGKTSTKMIRIQALRTAPSVSITVSTDGRQTTGKTGELVTLSEIESAGGGLGGIWTTTVVKNKSTGEEVEVIDGKFRPVVAGKYEAIYTVYDYVLQEKSYTYEINVATGDEPIFEDSVSLPKYFVNGLAHELPGLTAYDYTTGSRKEISAQIEVTDKDGTRTLSGNLYTPKVANSGDEVTVSYKATSSKNGVSRMNYNVKTIDVSDGEYIDITKYFIGNGITVQALEASLSLDAQADGSVEFIRPLMAEGFTTEFNIDGLYNNAQKIEITLTDSVNKDQQLLFTYEKSGTQTKFSVNRGLNYTLSVLFGGATVGFDIKIEGNSVKANTATVPLRTFLSGAEFTGFESNLVYLDIKLVGVTGKMSMLLKNINSQPLSVGVDMDLIAPKLYFYGTYRGDFAAGDVVNICAVAAYDVLNPIAKATVSVTRPGQRGEPIVYATATDGTVLEDVDSSRSYDILFDQIGAYSVVYTYIDGAGQSSTFGYSISCVDTVSPDITLSATSATVDIGKPVSLPKVTLSDNITAKEDVKVYKYLYLPSGRYERLGEATTFTPEKAGQYIVRHLAFDEAKNISVADFVVTAK